MQKYKKDGEVSYALGTELTLELVERHPEKVISVYVHSRQHDNEVYRRISELCRQRHIEVISSDKAFYIVGAKENCYIMGVFRKFHQEIDPRQNHVVLVNPSNMGNLGTIIRTIIGFGINDLAIITPAVDIFDPKVIRATMRAFFLLRFSLFASFEEYEKAAGKRTLYPFMLDRNAVTLDEVEKKEPYSLIFGNEATGLPEAFAGIGTPVFIRQLDTVDSLNLCNAVSIAAYEFTKEQLKNGKED